MTAPAPSVTITMSREEARAVLHTIREMAYFRENDEAVDAIQTDVDAEPSPPQPDITMMNEMVEIGADVLYSLDVLRRPGHYTDQDAMAEAKLIAESMMAAVFGISLTDARSRPRVEPSPPADSLDAAIADVWRL